MKSGEYISYILAQIASDEHMGQGCHQGAFFAAALSIISDIESPIKERALVSLVDSAVKSSAYPVSRSKKAA